VTEHRDARQIELAHEVGDVPIERMRLLARRFLEESEPDYVRDDDALSRLSGGQSRPGKESPRSDSRAAAVRDRLLMPTNASAASPTRLQGDGRTIRQTYGGLTTAAVEHE
jgi:hypothetical protein